MELKVGDVAVTGSETLYVDGKWAAASSGAVFEVTDPQVGARVVIHAKPDFNAARGSFALALELQAETDNAVALIRRVSQGRTLVMVEHDMGVVFDLADRISVLVYGEIIATDVPARIRSNAAVQSAYLGI